MLPKKNRADKKTVENIFKKGKFLNSPVLTFKFIPSNRTKISFLAPKSVARLAVKRNQLRRLGYATLKEVISNLPYPVSGVFVYKKKEEDKNILKNEIQNLLNKIN